MCVVIDVNGKEIIAPDEVYLDSNDIRRTVKFLEAESRIYTTQRKLKREARKAANNKPLWKRILM